MRIKKGDTVIVLTGKDVGKKGKVLKVLHDKSKVVVEGINIYKKNVKGNGRERESAIVDLVTPMDISNIQIVCNACGKATRVGYEVKGEDKIRVCKKCGKDLDNKVVSKPKKSANMTNTKHKSKAKPTKKKIQK